MLRKFLQLEWKAFFRSANLTKDISIKIFLGFMAAYMIVTALFFGIGLYPLLKEIFPEQEPMLIVNKFILVWFVCELMMRYILQNLPVLNMKPFLVHNIKRKQIVRVLLAKNFFSFYNVLAPLIIIPFAIWNFVKADFSALQILGWVTALLSLVLVANALNLLIQKKITANVKTLLPFLIVVSVLYSMEYFEIFSITNLTGDLFNMILVYPLLGLIFLPVILILYYLNFKILSENLYLDAYLKNDSEKFNDADFSWTQRFGRSAPFMQLDLKLIWRNKRPKNTVWLSLFFLLYGLFFYPNPAFEGGGAMFVFVGIFITGIFAINFGQFIPAWDSSYYSMMMSQNIPLRLYLESKVTLMYFSVIVLFILSTPYLYFGKHILILNLACAVYNLGINVPVMMYSGSFNKKRIDLDKSQFMNYQGMGAAQWIVGIPLLVTPILIWSVANYLGGFYVATALLALLGVIGILGKNYIMNFIVNAYQKRKYVMVNGFKQKDN